MFFYEKHWFGTINSYLAYKLIDPSFPYHFHRSYEIIAVTEGELSLNIGDKCYTVSGGEVAFIFPNQLHSFATNGHSVIMIVIFSPEMISDFTRQYHEYLPDSPILHYRPLSEAETLLTNLYLQKSFLYQMCGKLQEQTGFSTKGAGTDKLKLLHSILIFIERNYNEKCSLITLSHELGYDYTYLSKFFQHKMGVSFTNYLNQYRVMKSCDQLINTDDDISTIASDCGYDNIRTFNRNFKMIMGMTPKAFRNSPNVVKAD